VSLRRRTLLAPIAIASLAALAACGDDPSGPSAARILPGAPSNAELGVVLSSVGKSLTIFQAGLPTNTREIGLSASGSGAPTPTTFALRGGRVAVPLGDAASTAVMDLQSPSGVRYYTFRSGNATAAAWADDNTLLVGNLVDSYVGRIDASRAGGSVADTLRVAAAPAAIVIAGTRALVVSSNLDPKNNYRPLGNGVVTAVDPRTMTSLGVAIVGPNPNDAALGPDGKLYVVNTHDFTTGSVSIVDPQTLVVEQTVPGFGAGPTSIVIDRNGLAYVSGYGIGTLVWDTKTRTFVRGPTNPVCARVGTAASARCRGAADAAVATDGTLYQAFAGEGATLKPYVFVYRPGSFALADSITAGTDPTSIDVRAFR
jgi:YVTN family beta-propeller protein